jgi:hypothetical protein
MVIAKKPVGPRPEPLPILARVVASRVARGTNEAHSQLPRHRRCQKVCLSYALGNQRFGAACNHILALAAVVAGLVFLLAAIAVGLSRPTA